MMWIINTGAGPFGPVSDEQLIAMMRSGQLRSGWIAQAGTQNWFPVHQHPAYAAATAGTRSGAGKPIAIIVGVFFVMLALTAVVVIRTMSEVSSKVMSDPRGSSPAPPPVATTPTIDPAAEGEKALAATKAKFDKLYTLKDKYAARPSESMKPLDNGPFSLTGAAPTAFIDWEHPDSISSSDMFDVRFLSEESSLETSCSLASGKSKFQELDADEKNVIGRCAGAKYIVVANMTSLVKPQRTGTGFSGGSASAQIYLFNIDTLSLLGSFAVSAKSSDTVSFNMNGGYDADTKALYKDLGDNLQRAVADRWKALLKSDDFARP
jgi:hypothetical protein